MKTNVDYVRNAVEERIGRTVQDTEYRQACEMAKEGHYRNMEGKILLISMSIGGENFNDLGREN